MKKFYSFVFAAVALVGFAACNSDSVDEAAPVQKGETVTFVANIDTTRTDLDGLNTIWTDGDTIVVKWNENEYHFTNKDQEKVSTFSCTAVGLSGIVGQTVTATYSKNNDGKVDSTAGVAGAVLTAEGTFGELSFSIQSAFLKYTYTGKSELAVSLNGETVSTKTGTDVYVAFMPEGVNTLAYTLDGVTCKENKEFAPEAGKIYKMGEITEKVVLLKFAASVWDTDEAWFVAHFWNTTSAQDITFTRVNTNLYGCIVPNNMTHVLFCRMNPKYSTFAWNNDTEKDHVWNQTNNFGIASAPYNRHYVFDWTRSLWINDNEVVSSWGMAGSMTDWANGRYGMQSSGTANEVVARCIALEKDGEFKFTNNSTWTPNANQKVANTGIFDVYFNTSTKEYNFVDSKF